MKEMEKLKEQVEEKIKTITEQGVQGSNLEVLGKLVDIHKDLKEVEHWENEDGGKAMYRGEYGNRGYGEGYSEGGYGRRGNYREGGYSEGGYSEGSYGRRGVKGTGRGRRYRGDDMLDEMYGNYRGYMEGREQYNEGNYGAKHDSMEALKYMLESTVDFFEMLKQDATSQEELDLVKKYAKKISEML